MRKRDIKCRYWCRTIWSDMGASDGLIVEVNSSDLTVYFPDENRIQRTEFFQVIEIGKKLSDMGDCDTGLAGYKVLQEN